MHLLEPKSRIDDARKPFDNTGLRALIVPLFIEQLLVMLVGVIELRW